jgi:alcohol dehydrogenase class IV
MGFDFSTSNRILFGNGTLQQAGGLAFNLGRRALLVTGKGGADPASLIASLEAAGVLWDQFSFTGEPDLNTASAGIQAGRSFNADLAIGFGGGSSLDAAKAIAALVTNPGEPLDYLEVVGRGQPLTQLPLPVIAIPTTAGTGSEVTRNAVLSVPEQRVKVSLRHPAMVPRLALVDPQLTISLPPYVTASTGMDALTQLIEPYVSTRANEMTDLFCLEGMQRASTSLVEAFENGDSLSARTDMAPFTVWQRPSVVCSKPRMGHSVPTCCRLFFASIFNCCKDWISPHPLPVLERWGKSYWAIYKLVHRKPSDGCSTCAPT